MALVVFVGGPFVYIHYIEGDPPPKLSLSDLPAVTTTIGSKATGASGPTTTGSAATTSSVAGTYTVGSGSTAGYRVKENLFGPGHHRSGRTSPT